MKRNLYFFGVPLLCFVLETKAQQPSGSSDVNNKKVETTVAGRIESQPIPLKKENGEHTEVFWVKDGKQVTYWEYFGIRPEIYNQQRKAKEEAAEERRKARQ